MIILIIMMKGPEKRMCTISMWNLMMMLLVRIMYNQDF